MVVLAVEKYIIENKQDFEIFSKYAPAQFIDCELISKARKVVNDKGLFKRRTHGAFNTLNQFRKLEDMMMDPVVMRVLPCHDGIFPDWNIII